MGSTPTGGSGNSFSEFFTLFLLYPSHQKIFGQKDVCNFCSPTKPAFLLLLFFLLKIMVGPSPPLDPPLQKYSSRQAGVFLLHMVN